MTEIRRCSRCGADMLEGVEGLCPRCLFEAGLESKSAESEFRESESGRAVTDAYRAGFTPPAIDELAPHFSAA